MHTVRTQLDYFQRVIPRIADTCTAYAVDFPGMGWSDIVPGASYCGAGFMTLVSCTTITSMSSVASAGAPATQPCQGRSTATWKA